MEEPSLLFSVKRIVGRVEIQDNPIRGGRMGFEKNVHEESIHGSSVQHDLLVPSVRSALRRHFQPIQRTLAGQRLPSILLPAPTLAGGICFLDQCGKEGIDHQFVMVIQVLISQHQPVHPLGNELPQCVLDQTGIPIVGEAIGELGNDPRGLVELSQQERPCIRGDRAAVKLGDHFFPMEVVKCIELCGV